MDPLYVFESCAAPVRSLFSYLIHLISVVRLWRFNALRQLKLAGRAPWAFHAAAAMCCQPPICHCQSSCNKEAEMDLLHAPQTEDRP